MLVLAVDYRLAPEHKFPAAVEDSLAAYRFLRSRGREIGADPGRIGVAGDSAGGNLSAVVSQLAARSELPVPTCQVLIYPAVDFFFETASHRDLEHGHVIPRDRIIWYAEQYLRGQADRTDPRAAPVRTTDLTGQPPALVVTAGFDPLRDEGRVYADRLRESGVDVVYHEYPGQIHAFISLTKVIPQGMARARWKSPTTCGDRQERSTRAGSDCRGRESVLMRVLTSAFLLSPAGSPSWPWRARCGPPVHGARSFRRLRRPSALHGGAQQGRVHVDADFNEEQETPSSRARSQDLSFPLMRMLSPVVGAGIVSGLAVGAAPNGTLGGDQGFSLHVTPGLALTAFGVVITFGAFDGQAQSNIFRLLVGCPEIPCFSVGNPSGLDPHGGSVFLGVIAEPGFVFNQVTLEAPTPRDDSGEPTGIVPAWQLTSITFAPSPLPGTLLFLPALQGSAAALRRWVQARAHD